MIIIIPAGVAFEANTDFRCLGVGFQHSVSHSGLFAGHFGTVYHGYLTTDHNNREIHCAVKSLSNSEYLR